MPMDEIIRAIEGMDAENMQDLLDALIARYDDLYPDQFLFVASLSKNDSTQWNTAMKQALHLLRRCAEK